MDMKCLTAKLDMCKTQFYYYCISIDENLGKDLIMKIQMSNEKTLISISSIIIFSCTIVFNNKVYDQNACFTNAIQETREQQYHILHFHLRNNFKYIIS